MPDLQATVHWDSKYRAEPRTLGAGLLNISGNKVGPPDSDAADAAKGRYRLLVKGRTKSLRFKVACCKLEFAVEQEQREHEATRRARVEANVRAALLARDSEPEAKAKSIG
jgi:hypothetical protein